MRERLPATRLNLLRLRRDTERARGGLRLLKSKREALMKAFLACVSERLRYHDLLAERSRRAVPPLAEALAEKGLSGLASYGWAARREFALEARQEVVWGVPVATLRGPPLARDFRSRGFDPAGAGPAVNRAADHFEELLAVILDAAATDVRLKTLGAEIRRTSRRVAALEDRVLPELRLGAKRIGEKIEELERDENQRLRRRKSRRPAR